MRRSFPQGSRRAKPWRNCYWGTPVLSGRGYPQGAWGMMGVSAQEWARLSVVVRTRRVERKRMKERLAKLNSSLPEAHIPSGTERLATAEELAEIGGAPSDPMTEAQILALLEE